MLNFMHMILLSLLKAFAKKRRNLLKKKKMEVKGHQVKISKIKIKNSDPNLETPKCLKTYMLQMLTKWAD